MAAHLHYSAEPGQDAGLHLEGTPLLRWALVFLLITILAAAVGIQRTRGDGGELREVPVLCFPDTLPGSPGWSPSDKGLKFRHGDPKDVQ
jgi:hypothetical protein